MKGYVARKGERWYAVIYEGLDPVTGRERRSWHPAGTERADAERLAARLAAKANGRNDEVRSLTFGAYLTNRWLPGKKLVLATNTWTGYRRNVERHVIPAIGRVPIRRLRDTHLNALYERLLHPTDGRRALSPKTVLEVQTSSEARSPTRSAAASSRATSRSSPTHRDSRPPNTPSSRPGPSSSCRRSCGPPQVIACSAPLGCSPSPACGEASCSG